MAKKKAITYVVKDKFIKCVVNNSEGRFVLKGLSQSKLKALYNSGHSDKIKVI